MKPIDKFGRPIYSNIFSVLLTYGQALEKVGWRESYTQPNLFLKEFDGVTVFADMRSAADRPIWVDATPLIYASNEEKEDWKRRHALKKATDELKNIEVPWRDSVSDEWEPGDIFLMDSQNLPNGFCKQCNTDMNKNGLFCSDECESKFKEVNLSGSSELRKKFTIEAQLCPLCNTYKPVGDFERHHTDYEKDDTITICRSCHRWVTVNREKHPDFSPDRKEFLKQKKEALREERQKNIQKIVKKKKVTKRRKRSPATRNSVKPVNHLRRGDGWNLLP